MTEWQPQWSVQRYVRDYLAAVVCLEENPIDPALSLDEGVAALHRQMAEIDPSIDDHPEDPAEDDTTPEIPVVDLPADVPNGDIGASEPAEGDPA